MSKQLSHVNAGSDSLMVVNRTLKLYPCLTIIFVLFCCPSRAAQNLSAGRMRPAGRRLDNTVLKQRGRRQTDSVSVRPREFLLQICQAVPADLLRKKRNSVYPLRKSSSPSIITPIAADAEY